MRQITDIIGYLMGFAVVSAIVLGVINYVQTQTIRAIGNEILEFVGLREDKNKANNKNSPQLEPPPPFIVQNNVIVLGLKELALLETVSSDVLLESLVRQERPSILKDAKLHITYTGRITAGIDLSLIEEEEILVQEQSVTITLPPAQITGCYVQQKDVLESSCGTTNPLYGCGDTMDNLYDTAQKNAINGLLEVEDESAILSLAYENAEKSIRSFLINLGYKNIEIIRSSEVLPLDASCTP